MNAVVGDPRWLLRDIRYERDRLVEALKELDLALDRDDLELAVASCNRLYACGSLFLRLARKAHDSRTHV